MTGSKRKNNDVVVNIAEGISAVSTALAAYGIASGWLGDNVWVNGGALIFFFFIGLAVSFYIQRQLNKNNLLWWSLGLSLLLSLTYPANSKLAMGLAEENSYLKIDPLYDSYVEKVALYGSVDEVSLSDLSTKRAELKTLIDKEKSFTTNNNQSLSLSITKQVSREYADAKANGSYGSWWKKEGLISGCYDVVSLSGNSGLRQVRKDCLSEYRLKLQVAPSSRLSELKVLLKEVDGKIALATTSNSTNSLNLKKYQDLVTGVQARAKASVQDEDTIKMFLWMVGLFIEGLLSFKQLMLRSEKRGREKTYKEAIKEVNSFNKLLSDYLIEYAYGRNNELEIATQRNKDNYVGVHMGRKFAIANSLIGAYLALLSHKKNDMPLMSFRDVTVLDILEINGKVGTEVSTTGKRRMKSVSTFWSSTLQRHIQTLGSTATTLTVRGSKISPQQHALDFLIGLEDEGNYDLLGLSPFTFREILTRYLRKTYS